MTDTADMVTVLIDNRSITAAEGSSLLAACLENGIYIPNLCFLESDDRPTASCRLCFVELDSTASPVPACTITVVTGLKVKTDTDAVRRLQRSALRLLLSAHDVDCKNCHANHHCELQNIARFLKTGLKPEPLPQIDISREMDTSHPFIDHFPHRCVLCSRCIRICGSRNVSPAFSFINRGIDTVIRHYPQSHAADLHCPDCRRCIDICPAGALMPRDNK